MKKTKKFIYLLQEKVNYLFENPEYNKIDLVLSDIIDNMNLILSPKNFMKYFDQLNIMLNDLKVVKEKRIEREKRLEERKINSAVTHEMEKAVLKVKINDLENDNNGDSIV